jgi:hypothetical protein
MVTQVKNPIKGKGRLFLADLPSGIGDYDIRVEVNEKGTPTAAEGSFVGTVVVRQPVEIANTRLELAKDLPRIRILIDGDPASGRFDFEVIGKDSIAVCGSLV